MSQSIQLFLGALLVPFFVSKIIYGLSVSIYNQNYVGLSVLFIGQIMVSWCGTCVYDIYIYKQCGIMWDLLCETKDIMCAVNLV
jgi:hypothetical protein